jgi:hypothetical protein
MRIFRQLIQSNSPAVEVERQVNRIFVIDCSGSMSGELPAIRSQMKNKIPQLTNIGDTVSIIWFSGRGECGILQDGIEVKSVKDFGGMNSAIDKFLRPVCLTGFKEPLELVGGLAQKLTKARPGSVNHMFFMTDGYDNQWNEKEILTAIKNLEPVLDTATLVEFGWCCNRPLMTKMAESIGANLLFTESFEQYDENFSVNLTKKIKSGKRRKVKLENESAKGFAFYEDQGEIFSFIVESGTVSVPESAVSILYPTDSMANATSDRDLYLGVYCMAQRMQGNEVFELLGLLGDVHLVEMFSNCFSKQDYSEFQAEVMTAALDETKRYKKGKDFNCVPAEDAFTILDLMDVLASDEGNKFHPYDPAFTYERISAKRDQSDSVVTQGELDELLEQMKLVKSADELDAIQKKIEELKSGKLSLKFIPSVENVGCPIQSLTFHETRPNVSIMIRIDGSIELPQKFATVPAKFPIHIFRNYTVVKDGIRHSSCRNLPFELTKATFDTLQGIGLLAGQTFSPGKIYYIDANLPVINRKMAKSLSAKEFFQACVDLQKFKSEQKVYNTYTKNLLTSAPETSWDALYGAEAVAWLKEIGITPGGFSPKSVKGESTDVYTAKEFNVKIASCSSIPAVNEKVIAKVVSGGKMTLSESICAPAIKKVESLLGTDAYKAAANPQATLSGFLRSEKDAAKAKVRKLALEIAKSKMAVMVGHVWFKEFASLEENSMQIEGTFDCTAELRDIEVSV